MSSVEGRSCLVTGGTRGIGKAIVEEFAKEKARVFTCSRHQDELDNCLKDWKEVGYDVEGCVCDVSHLEDLKNLVNKANSGIRHKMPHERDEEMIYGTVVNNAGMIISRRAIDYEEDDFDALIAANLKSAYNLSRFCHPMLKAAGTASVVHIGSIAGGDRVLSTGCVHAMTKASLSVFARSLACEWAADGIRVNCIAPGGIETPMAREVFKKKELLDELLKEVPMKRVGRPEEISGVVAFFCSEKASFITGQTLYVDGGYSVRGLGY